MGRPDNEAAGKHSGVAAAKEKEHRLPTDFPKGLRVLVVDDDPLCLKIIEQMLKHCNYEVCTCATAAKALEQLRDKSHDFDLVLSDVYMPDMDGFKLLEAIGLELDLPVIMMSSNGEHTTVMRGVTHGACDFLIKPVRVEELRNIWQHVIRRSRTHHASAQQLREVESEEGGNEMDADSNRKRKELCRDNSMTGERDDEAGSSKKPRVVWSVEMHQQFVHAVNQLGIDKAVPKKILELMNVDGLTRENVASHLQKYRLYLKRVQAVNPGAAAAAAAAAAATAAAGGSGGGGLITAGSLRDSKSGSGVLQQQPQQQQEPSPPPPPLQQPQQPAPTQQLPTPPQQVQPPQQPMVAAGGMAGMPGADIGLGSLMGQSMPNMGFNPMANPMASLLAGLNQNMMGMTGMPGLPGMPPMSGLGQAAAAGGQLMGQAMPGMQGPLGPLPSPMGMGPMGMPGMPGLPAAMQGMGLGMGPMHAAGMGVASDPSSLMNSMMANMQAFFQSQQAAAPGTAANAVPGPTSSGAGSSGAPPVHPPGAAAAAAAVAAASLPGMQPPLMPNAATDPTAAEAAFMAAACMSPAAAAAAMMGHNPAVQRAHVAGVVNSVAPGVAAGAAAGASDKPDFSHVFDDVLDAAPVPPPGGPAGNSAGGVDEFLDFFLKS